MRKENMRMSEKRLNPKNIIFKDPILIFFNLIITLLGTALYVAFLTFLLTKIGILNCLMLFLVSVFVMYLYVYFVYERNKKDDNEDEDEDENNDSNEELDKEFLELKAEVEKRISSSIENEIDDFGGNEPVNFSDIKTEN